MLIIINLDQLNRKHLNGNELNIKYNWKSDAEDFRKILSQLGVYTLE